MANILIIDDNQSVAIALEVLFSLHDLRTITTSSPEEGLMVLKVAPIDLVIQDMNFSAETTSGEDGIRLFEQIRQLYPDLPVILLTAWTHLDAAIGLIKAGAADYIAKPWDDQRLITTVQNLIELGESNRVLHHKIHRERQHKRTLEKKYDLRQFVWQDSATERLLSVACQVARADVPILITGPNGSGKERIAEIIQANSSVKEGPFVVLNCGAIPSELIEAELFGADAGAYTGANKSREGKFEAANGGTLFLDEIGNLPLSGQMKLLRVLETGRFVRLGSNKEQQVKVRIISATNADLPAMIKAGNFREDLFYRLNLIELILPSLTERPDDILPLAEQFLEDGKTLHPLAQAALQRYNWPGNVRELKNKITRACLLAQSEEITVQDLALPQMSVQHIELEELELDRAMIESALKKAQGIVSQAATQLGLSRQALYRRMDRLGISRNG